MKINQEKCIQCENCVPYCPMEAIIPEDGKVIVDFDECVECNICYHSEVCPVEALIPDDLTDELRSFRNTFSDPLQTHSDTNVLGRGTEEMKTNDVTGNFKPGYVGIGVELGRPGTGTRFYDVEKVAQTCAQFNANFANENPVTTIMEDRNTGKIKGKYLNEKTLSAIVEFTLPNDELPQLLNELKKVENEVETVFSVEVISKVIDGNKIPGREIAKNEGFKLYPNGKINVGLGKPKFEFSKEEK